MKIQKRKRIPWRPFLGDDIEDFYHEQTDEYIEAVPAGSVGGKHAQDYLKVSCKVCKVIIFKKISGKSWRSWISTKEQRHHDSEEHKQNILMTRLEGEGA